MGQPIQPLVVVGQSQMQKVWIGVEVTCEGCGRPCEAPAVDAVGMVRAPNASMWDTVGTRTVVLP